jgi:hypothetical protein
MHPKINIATGLISLGLLVALIYKLTSIPGGMFLSGLFLGVMWVTLIIVISLFVAWLSKFILKKVSFSTIFLSVTVVGFTYFHYQIYSPTVKIIVPENFVGEVNLIKSNMDENILTLDSNGIGYLTEWTFNHLHNKPIIIDQIGTDISEFSVGFSRTHFWGVGSVIPSGSIQKIRFKSFEIVPWDKIGEKQFYNTNLTELVDKEKTQ